MLDQALQKLIDLVSNLAPRLWEIALRQVYVLAYQDVILSIAGVLLVVVGYLSQFQGRRCG